MLKNAWSLLFVFAIFAHRIVPDLDDDSRSSKSDDSPDHEDGPTSITSLTQNTHQGKLLHNLQSTNIISAEDDAIGDGLLTGIGIDGALKTDSPNQLERTDSLTLIPGQVERRRRKLPEIPKTKRCKCSLTASTIWVLLHFIGVFSFQLPYYWRVAKHRWPTNWVTRVMRMSLR